MNSPTPSNNNKFIIIGIIVLVVCCGCLLILLLLFGGQVLFVGGMTQAIAPAQAPAQDSGETPLGDFKYKNNRKCVADPLETVIKALGSINFGGGVRGPSINPYLSGPPNGSKAGLMDTCGADYQFKMLSNGAIQHKLGKCLHPEGGSENPNNGTKLVYHDGCDKHTFKRLSKQYKNGKCIHPESGSTEPTDGTNLVLWDGCDKHFFNLGT